MTDITMSAILYLVASAALLLQSTAATSCAMTDDTCEFWLEVEHKLTMMHGRKAVYGHAGKLYHYDVTNTSSATPVDPEEVVIADGWEPNQRIVGAINGTMPGPPIVVYEGQTVIVHVKNKMTSASLTIHWHGLHQKGTGFMDGVAYITQCPIPPYSSFTYEFKAYPRGTFWYHSHIGTQLSAGVVGALIIKEKKQPVMDEHIMLLMDWNHQLDADLNHMMMVYGMYENRTKVSSTDSLEGGHFSLFVFHSGLINGRGRFFFDDGTYTQAPLTVFPVQQGQQYRFRIIGGGSLYPFRVSIDDHPITLIASDGFDLEPVIVESFVINPGERYDVIITANQTVANYWVRAESLEVDVQNHIALAILRYEGAPDEDPRSSRAQCSQGNRCLVVNCPYDYYPEHAYTDCQRLGDLHSASAQDSPTPGGPNDPDEDVEDIFMNFAFPGISAYPGSVNGMAFRKPPVSALTQPAEIPNKCNSDICGEGKHCFCAGSVDLQNNKVYQFIFLNMGNGKGWPHPIHMHGHSFHVVKMGYPPYNDTTGKLLGDNLDIDCGGHPDRDQSFCNNASWTNGTWGGNDVPGLNLINPPVKDTIIVPTGGYAVVRIRADNPGVWFVHCHIELHNIDGMAIMMNESYELQPTPPKGFPVCGDFVAGQEHRPQWMDEDDDDKYSEEEFWLAVGILLGVIFLLLVIVIVLACCLCRKGSTGSGYNMGGENAGGTAHVNSGFSKN